LARPFACSAAGFTLIETIIVLAIVGLGLGLITGFLARPHMTRELAAANARIVGTLRDARSLAMVESLTIHVVITQDGHGIRGTGLLINLSPRGYVTTLDNSVISGPMEGQPRAPSSAGGRQRANHSG
jgi:prepilin-type N-terminal cleavage/methylation domain-containing protein